MFLLGHRWYSSTGYFREPQGCAAQNLEGDLPGTAQSPDVVAQWAHSHEPGISSLAKRPLDITTCRL